MRRDRRETGEGQGKGPGRVRVGRGDPGLIQVGVDGSVVGGGALASGLHSQVQAGSGLRSEVLGRGMEGVGT